MFKKIFVLFMTAVGVFSSVTSVNAGTISTDGGAVSVPVTYTVDNTYFEVVIPATISVGTEVSSFEVTSSSMNLRPDEAVKVSITSGCDSNGIVKLKRQNVAAGKDVATLDTTFSIDGKKISENNYVVGLFNDENGVDNLVNQVDMSALVVNKNTPSGDYKATVVFTVNLVKV